MGLSYGSSFIIYCWAIPRIWMVIGSGSWLEMRWNPRNLKKLPWIVVSIGNFTCKRSQFPLAKSSYSELHHIKMLSFIELSFNQWTWSHIPNMDLRQPVEDSNEKCLRRPKTIIRIYFNDIISFILNCFSYILFSSRWHAEASFTGDLFHWH